MEVITDEIAERGLRRKALALWILSGALVAVTIGSILFYRNRGLYIVWTLPRRRQKY